MSCYLSLKKETDHMSLSTKPIPTSQRRIWKAPTSHSKWYWLAASVILLVAIAAWYAYAIKTQQQSAGPFTDPLRLFGIISFILVLSAATYSLRRRFVRGLPGMVQDWLWMHTWIGIIAILIAMFHENFASLLASPVLIGVQALFLPSFSSW
jgi:asparagine N-glycosylation enzyme membrane subunit Stt3